ncbi:Arm DNA-binding domain-containing protein [Hymenobacter sp. GOD-10R]|uniref:Arm DNA-binding domain-containing protein n=1 Tax=Hymenobacter sp. GOD-10R TaxID=3093922 RepID=UPI002D7A2B68|nr:Arm DNA-binding domain-containing protein [Hymenobacter sp. GOD-10R]WRQ31157.1 Arm DNA-binding domain-containing protein [Hymenobacter sp. GOD-10R]
MAKKHKAKTAGHAPISLRITIHGQHSEYSTKFCLLPSEWNPKNGKRRGTSQASIDTSSFLKLL